MLGMSLPLGNRTDEKESVCGDPRQGSKTNPGILAGCMEGEVRTPHFVTLRSSGLKIRQPRVAVGETRFPNCSGKNHKTHLFRFESAGPPALAVLKRHVLDFCPAQKSSEKRAEF